MDTTITSKQRVIESIQASIDEVNQTLAPDRQLERDPSTVLFGEGSKLESLGLVTLIVGVEQRISDDLGVTVTLVNEKAMSLRNSPFRTVETLTDYVMELIAEAEAAA